MALTLINNLFIGAKVYLDTDKFKDLSIQNCTISREDEFVKVSLGEIYIASNDKSSLLINSEGSCLIDGNVITAASIFCEMLFLVLSVNNVREVVCFDKRKILFTFSKDKLVWNGNCNETFIKKCNTIISLFIFN